MRSPAILAIAAVLAVHGISPRASAGPARLRPRPVQLVGRPVLESVTPDSAVIRWTDTSSGGTRTHYGIVRYGLDPRHLDRTARSPNRARRHAAAMTYRVWIDGLAPNTTYYYTVDAAQADGIAVGLHGPVTKFTTPPRS